jgi:hypothetical protein
MLNTKVAVAFILFVFVPQSKCFLFSWSIKGKQTFIKDSIVEESVQSNVDYISNLTGFIFKKNVQSALFQNISFEFTSIYDGKSDFQFRQDFRSKRELNTAILSSLIDWLGRKTNNRLIQKIDVEELGRLSPELEQLIEKTFKPKFLLTTETQHFTFKYVIENSSVVF